MCVAKPATALLPFRAGSAAFLSSSSSDKATTMKTPATIPGNPGTPPPMKVARREVPLPSQEGKKGAMQYALYVVPILISGRGGG
jgi:NADH dehydrogenase (ubiquinone) Fe-S protein 7